MKQKQVPKCIGAGAGANPFRQTTPDLSLDGLIHSPSKQANGGITRFNLVASGTDQAPKDADLVELFRGDLMTSVFSTSLGSAIYKKALQGVMKERYGDDWFTQEPTPQDRELAKMRAWTEWRENCDLFKDWKPGKTVFNMPAITPEMLARPGNELTSASICDTVFIPKPDAVESADIVDRERCLATPQGKILFLKALGKYAEIQDDGVHRSMAFTEQQIEEAKRSAWKEYKQRKCAIDISDTIIDVPAVQEVAGSSGEADTQPASGFSLARLVKSWFS